MSGAWLREEQADLATEKILDAAGRAFADLGVSRARMGHIAQYAGCSRATLYRYFKTRSELQLAYVDLMAQRMGEALATELAGIADPRERLVESVLRAVRRVRETPGTAAWFDASSAGHAAQLSRGSLVVSRMTTGLADRLVTGASGSRDLRARWLVRVILSLLTLPGESAAEERELVERFVVPGLLP